MKFDEETVTLSALRAIETAHKMTGQPTPIEVYDIDREFKSPDIEEASFMLALKTTGGTRITSHWCDFQDMPRWAQRLARAAWNEQVTWASAGLLTDYEERMAEERALGRRRD